MSPNSLLVIQPYRWAGTWVFDDPKVDLRAEPFVAGIPEMIDDMVAQAKIENAEAGFRLLFSALPFPGVQLHLVKEPDQIGAFGGTWYRKDGTKETGWLCPALFKYFPVAPEQLYARAEPLRPVM